MTSTAVPNSFKVIIVGGSISGLTLAHALHRAGIPHTVLEKRKTITFDGGASISLQSNGLRILDQLGLYQDILKTTAPIRVSIWRDSNGKVVRKSRFMQMVEERHGYPILCLERSELLDVLYEKYEKKEHIVTSSEVVKVDSRRDEVVVSTKNGKVYKGDIVVGADGIHSSIRKYMWDVERERDSEAARKAENSLISQWFCAFGVSNQDFRDPALFPGALQILYNSHRCNTIFSSTRNRVFWFLIQKHDRLYTYPDIPRYTTSEAEGIMEKVVDKMHVTENTNMRDLWERRSKFAMTSLEEVVFEKWWEGRVCLVGDSVHKMTPTAGQGGNTAIESVAVLANLLYDAKTGKMGSLNDDCFREIFEAYQNSRTQRVLAIAESSGAMTRIQTLDSAFWSIMAKVLSVLGEDWETNSTSDLMCKSEALKFVEYKGQKGTVPLTGWTLDMYADSPKALSVQFARYFRYLVFYGLVWSILQQLWLALDFRSLPLFSNLRSFLHHGMFRANINSAITFDRRVVPSPVQNIDFWAYFSAGMNLVPIGIIAAIEILRVKNLRTLSNTPCMVLGVALVIQLEGYSKLALLYLTVENITSTRYSREPKDYIVPTKYAKSLFLALLCTAGVLVLLALQAALVSPLNETKITQSLLSSAILSIPPLPLIIASVIANTKLQLTSTSLFGYEDLPHILGTLQLAAILSAFTHLFNALLYTTGWRDGLEYRISPHTRLAEVVLCGSGLDEDIKEIYWLLIALSMIWCLWSVMKFRRPQERSLCLSAKLLLQVVLGSVLTGPGATMAILWIGREDKTRCLDSRLRNGFEGEANYGG